MQITSDGGKTFRSYTVTRKLKTKEKQYGDFEIILLLKALKGQVKECAGFDPEIEKAVKYLTKRGVDNV